MGEYIFKTAFREIAHWFVTRYIFYFHLDNNGDEDVVATNPSSPGPVVFIRRYNLSPVTRSPLPELKIYSTREEWVVFYCVSRTCIHDCRTNMTWRPQCPYHSEVRLQPVLKTLIKYIIFITTIITTARALDSSSQGCFLYRR